MSHFARRSCGNLHLRDLALQRCFVAGLNCSSGPIALQPRSLAPRCRTTIHFDRRFQALKFTIFHCLGALALVLTAVVATDVLAQAGSEPGDIVRITTELVQTDVTVVDAQGKFVRGLKPEQFELRVDGKPVGVSFVEQVDGFGEAKSTAATPRAPRKVVIFFDDLHLSRASVEHLRRAVPELLDGPLRHDEVAIVSASGQIGFLQQFTRHRAVWRAAVSRLIPQPTEINDTENPPLSEYVAIRIAHGDKDALTYYTNDLLRSLQFQYLLPKYGGKGAGFMVGSESDQASRVILQRAEALVARSNSYTNATLSALDGFLRNSARTPGRKIVLFITDGFFLDGDSSRLKKLTDAAARTGAVVYPLDARSLSQRGSDSRMRTDAFGRADEFSSDEHRASQTSLILLAEQTGGRALLTATTLTTAAHETLSESSNYYVLAWRPNPGGEQDQFRQLAVSIADRPGLTVRFGRGYLNATSKAEIGPAVTSSTKGLPAQLGLTYLDTPENEMVLTASTQVTVDAPAHGQDGKQPAAIDLAGVVFNDRGEGVSKFGTRLNVDPPASNAAAGPSAVIYNHRAPLAPGIYQVRVALRDDRSGRMGHAAEWVEVPELKSGTFTLSSLLLGGEAVNRGTSKTDAPQMQFSVDRRFPRNSRLSLMLFAYNVGRGSSTPNLSAEIRVLRDGRSVLAIPRQQVPVDGLTDPNRVFYGGSFPLSSLSPGTYELIVSLTDNVTRRTATQQQIFTVE